MVRGMNLWNCSQIGYKTFGSFHRIDLDHLDCTFVCVHIYVAVLVPHKYTDSQVAKRRLVGYVPSVEWWDVL